MRYQTVGAGAVRDLVDLDPEPPGQCGAQPVGVRVGIAIEVVRLGLENLAGNREGSEGAFVGGEFRNTSDTELALYFLNRLAGLIRRDRRQGRPNKASIDAGSYLHGRTLASANVVR